MSKNINLSVPEQYELLDYGTHSAAVRATGHVFKPSELSTSIDITVPAPILNTPTISFREGVVYIFDHNKPTQAASSFDVYLNDGTPINVQRNY